MARRSNETDQMDEVSPSLREEIATLRASEERYRFFVESIPQLVWSCDAQGLTTDFSERCLQYMGLTLGEAYGSGWKKVVHPDDIQEATRRWLKAVAEESDYTGEYRILCAADGVYRWFKATGAPMRDADGKVVAWFGTSTEIDAEKRAQEELAITHSKLKAVFANSPVAFFSTDAGGIIDLLEGAGLEAMGVTAQEWIGKLAADLCEDDEVHAKCVTNALRGNPGQQYHERNGVWLDMRYAPLYDEQNRVIGMTCVATDFTAMKRADEEVKKSHRVLKTVLSSSPMVFWATDANGILTVIEGNGLQKLGLEADEFIGTHARTLDRSSASHSQCIAQALGGRSAQQYCERQGIWMDCRYEPMVNDADEVIGIACVATDVTAERAKSSQLKASEAKYRSLTEAIPVLIWALQPTGIATFVNKAFEDFTGLTVDDYNSLGHKAFMHPDDLVRLLNVRGDALATGKEVFTENRYRRKDGEYRWFVSGIKPVRNEAGEITHWIGTSVDIHERKLAEQALVTSEERLRFYLESTRDGIWDWDVPGGKRTWSDRNYELLGLRPGECEPSLDAVLAQVRPDDVASVAGVLERSIDSDVMHGRMQFRIRNFDSEYKWRQSEYKIFRDETGKATRVVGATTDIHEQKVIEHQIRTLNEQLEERVHERTQELEATTGELQEFCYSVSHDLRGPLRSINGFSQALEEDYGHQLDDTARDHLARIRNATIKLSDLIDALLSMSRITRAEMARRKVDISDIAASVIEDLRALEPGRKVDVVIAPNLTTYGDGPLIQIALTNLIENAWKFTSKTAKARIEIGAESKSIFFVRDNGAGFEMTYASKLFSPFQRLHTVSDFPGTGIGLAIVSRVIQRHGGSITAEAEIDKGARFTFTLPSRQGDRAPK